MIKSRIVILPVFIFFFIGGCVQNVHKNTVSPEESSFSNYESSPDHATTSDNADVDVSEISEKVDAENQNSLLADSAGPEDSVSSSDPNHLTNGQNHESEDSDQAEKILALHLRLVPSAKEDKNFVKAALLLRQIQNSAK